MALVRTMSGSSKHRASASQDTGYLSADDGLKRTSSRLQPPNPAYTFGSPSGGILINATRPYSNHSASSSVASVTTPLPGTSPAERISLPSASSQQSQSTRTRSTEHSPDTSATELSTDRGRSTSRDDAQNRKIRFAPLPEVRPRSYSTGRNVWLEEGDDFEDGVRRANPDDARGLVVHRAGDEVGDVDDEVAIDEPDSDDESRSSGIFGSWGGSLSGRNSIEKENEPTSYTNKLLRPLSFGKRKKSNSSMNKERRLSTDSGDLSLNRTETTESDASREPSVGSVPKSRATGSGVPLRKSRTWELGEAPSTGRRANYPPVAQRSRARGPRPAAGPTIDPNFVEWGFGSTGQGAVKPAGSVVDDDDDDGSGLAWIKRRREAKKREEEQQAAAAAAATAANQADAETQNNVEDEEIDSGAATPVPPAVVLHSSKTPQMSGLSASRPVLGVATQSGEMNGLSSPLSTSSDSRTSASTTNTSTASSPADDEDLDDDEDDSDDEDENRDSSDDSDLDEEELAAEEALAAKARATSKSAGSERYHSATHESRLLQVNEKAK